MIFVKIIQTSVTHKQIFNSKSLIFICNFNSSSKNRNANKMLRFVPRSQNLEDVEFHKINEFVTKSKKLFILSGAGLSTESGYSNW